MGRWAFWCGGWYFIPWRRPGRIRMNQCCHCMLYSPVRTLCTNRRGCWPNNLSPHQRTYNPMGTSCLRWSYVPRQQQHNRTGMMLMGLRQMRPLAQLSNIIQLFVSSRIPVSQTVNRTCWNEKLNSIV